MSADPGSERQRAEPQSRGLSRRQLLLIAGGGTAIAVAGGGIAAVQWGQAPPDPPPFPSTPPRPPSPAEAARRLSHPFWTAPLPADAPQAASSEDYVGRLTYQASMGPDTSPVALGYAYPYNIATLTTDYSLCIYRLPDDWPRRRVWCKRKKAGLQTVLDAGVPVPDPAHVPDGNIAPEGTDGAVIFLQGDQLWEFWQFTPGGPSGYEWSCEQGGHMANYRRHPGWWSGSPAFGGGKGHRVLGRDWGVSACGQSYLGGILTAEDYYVEAITHPLPLALPITGGGASTPTHVLPATRYDQINFSLASDDVSDAYRLPEGARFRLPHSFNIESWVIQAALPEASERGTTAEVLRKILVCLRDYGLFIAESSGVVAFTGEHNKVYGTPYHPYSAAEVPVWGNFGHQIPWSALVQLQPPTTDISVPGSGPE